MLPRTKTAISLLLAVVLFIMCTGCGSTPAGAAGEIEVRFYRNDGTEDLFMSISGKPGDSIFKPSSAPEREGYLFAGWYLDPAGNDEYTNMPQESAAVYAKWALPCVVSFMSEGSEIPDMLLPADALITQPDQPVREGYLFDGWYTDDAYTTLWDFAVDKAAGNMTLYAKWTSLGFTVTLNLGDGNTSAVTTPGPLMEMPEEPGREGLKFEGWYKDEALSTPWDFSTDTVTADMNLYAKWSESAATYTVTFDSNGGGSVKSLTDVAQGATIDQPTSPKRSGYRFGGWYKDKALKSAWSFAKDRVTGDMTLYAKWNEATTSTPSYTVTFNSNGGTSVLSISDVGHGMTIGKPTDPTKSGYTFGGWYSDSALTRAWNFASDYVTGSFTLYAKWTVGGYTVTFNSNGGSAVASITGVALNATITKPTDPTKSGYVFGGWFRDTALSLAWTFSTDKVAENLTLYAKWGTGYTVTYNSNGGSAVGSYYNVPYYEIINAPASPTKSGYTFAGWYKESGLSNAWNFSTDRVTANITLYAKWAAGITVTFNSNGGSSVASQSIQYNTAVSKPTDPTRSGYVFNGWYYNGTLWDFSTKVTQDIVLYAMWNAASTVIVSFNANGGTSDPSSKTVTVGVSFQLPAAPTYANHIFQGWYTSQSGGAKAGGAGDWYIANSAITLYAQWKETDPPASDPPTSNP